VWRDIVREQIKLILEANNLEDAMTATKRMASLQRSGYKVVDMQIGDTQDYYLEVPKKPEV
jgi:precorrin-6B methylase 2